MEKEPGVEEFHDLYASFLESKKQYAKALDVLKKAIEKFPKSEKLIYFKGVLHERMGDKAAAIATIRTIFSMNSQNYHALNFVGYLYAEQGENLAEAEELVRKAIQLKPNDGFIEDSLGWILFKQGKLKESQEALERAAALQPDEAIICQHLGELHENLKDYAKAREFYQKAMSLALGKDKEIFSKVEKKLATLPKSSSEKTPDKRVPTAQSQ